MEKEREKAIEILSVFESYLSDKEVVIENEEKYDCGDIAPAVLYGTDYYDLEDAITEILKNKEK